MTNDSTLDDFFRLDNLSDEDLVLCADNDVPGAETELSRRLALKRLAQIKVEEKAKRESAKAAKGLFA